MTDPQDFFQSESALPPPRADEIDVLIDAAALGVRRAPVADASLPALAEPDFLSEDSARYAIQSALQSWRYRVSALLVGRFVVRWAAPTCAAFAVGTVATMWGMQALEPKPTDTVAAAAPVLTPSSWSPVAPLAPQPEMQLAVIPAAGLVSPLNVSMFKLPLTPVLPTVEDVMEMAAPVLPPSAIPVVTAMITRTIPVLPPALTPVRRTPPAQPTPLIAESGASVPLVAPPLVPRRGVEQPRAMDVAPATRVASVREITPLTGTPALVVVAPALPAPATIVATAEPVPAASAPPAPSATPASLSATAATAPVTDTRMRHLADRAAVRQTLDQYVDAFERMNVAAAAEVWPSVDRRALSRAFAALKSQGMDFDSCEVDVYDMTAVARCSGSVEFVPRIGGGSTRLAQQEWRFSMRKLPAGWKIEDVAASQSAAAANRLRGSY